MERMKVIVAGSRSVTDYKIIALAIEKSGFKIQEIVSGTAKGVDQLGERYGSLNKIPVKRFPADWDLHGRSAGYKRNEEMAEYADALVAVWDGKSRGTMHMISIAKKKGLKVHTHKAIMIKELAEEGDANGTN